MKIDVSKEVGLFLVGELRVGVYRHNLFFLNPVEKIADGPHDSSFFVYPTYIFGNYNVCAWFYRYFFWGVAQQPEPRALPAGEVGAIPTPQGDDPTFFIALPLKMQRGSF